MPSFDLGEERDRLREAQMRNARAKTRARTPEKPKTCWGKMCGSDPRPSSPPRSRQRSRQSPRPSQREEAQPAEEAQGAEEAQDAEEAQGAAGAGAEPKSRWLPGTEAFWCPITLKYMLDPVVAVDGNSYEREAIERWMRFGTPNALRSPITLEPLEVPGEELFIENKALKKASMYPITAPSFSWANGWFPDNYLDPKHFYLQEQLMPYAQKTTS